jgi:cell division protease FtsH
LPFSRRYDTIKKATNSFDYSTGEIMGNNSSKWAGNVFIYLIIGVALIAILFTFLSSGDGTKKLSLTDVLAMAKNGQAATIIDDGDKFIVTARGATGETFTVSKDPGTSIFQLLESEGISAVEQDIQIEVKQSGGVGTFFNVLFQFLPLIFFGAILLFMMRQAQGSNNQALGFGRSRARMFTGSLTTVTFADVAGADESKAELTEIVDFLKYPERYLALGARIPKGVLMVGQPGTGKTLLSKAVAGEAGVPFFSISGSEFVEMFVGVGASRVRDLFDQAKRNAPAIVFIDEIDAVGRHRGAGMGGGHDEREQTLNQILVEMDGFDTNTNVIIIAATNRPDILDPALLRPGRFDRRVMLDLPDINGRIEILKVHSKGKPLADDVDMLEVARLTPGFSGADLANLVNEAAIQAARTEKKQIDLEDLTESVDWVTMGPERKSRVITPQEKEIVAYHEAGHALVGHMLPNSDPVQKISIISRGMAAGYTKSLPTEDHIFHSRPQFMDELAMALGGRIAEELTFGQATTGASSDLEQVTKMATAMVTRYGMSEKLGPRTFGKRDDVVFLGREMGGQRDYSEKVAQVIDDEVHGIIEAAYNTATKLMKENYTKLVQIASYLIANEMVEGEELQKLFDSPAPPTDRTPASTFA